jgi:Holliday junction resolvase-like predicted endonuclease
VVRAEIDLEELGRRMSSGESIESVMERFGWKEFEDIVACIFSENNFDVERNFRFKTKRRYEIDLICSRNGSAILVDCKKWRAGRYKNSGLRNSVYAQNERLEEFSKLLKSNPAIQKRLGISSRRSLQPLIVTLMEECVAESECCFIVPVWKLNHFLLEM